MNALLWSLQIVLALVFAAHGGLFLVPPVSVAEQMNALLPRWFQLFLGLAEIAAALGLTLPGFTRIMPSFVPLAAAGIVVVMVGATVLHLMRAEWSSAVITALLLVMATLVAHHRWRVLPIQPRPSTR